MSSDNSDHSDVEECKYGHEMYRHCIDISCHANGFVDKQTVIIFYEKAIDIGGKILHLWTDCIGTNEFDRESNNNNNSFQLLFNNNQTYEMNCADDDQKYEIIKDINAFLKCSQCNWATMDKENLYICNHNDCMNNEQYCNHLFCAHCLKLYHSKFIRSHSGTIDGNSDHIVCNNAYSTELSHLSPEVKEASESSALIPLSNQSYSNSKSTKVCRRLSLESVVCEVCCVSLAEDKLFECTKSDKCKKQIACAACMRQLHRKRSHSGDYTNDYITCWNDEIIKLNKDCYPTYLERVKVGKYLEKLSKIEDIAGVCVPFGATVATMELVSEVMHHATIQVVKDSGLALLGNTTIAVLGAVGGALLVPMIESMYIFYSWRKGQISGTEAIQLVAKCTVSGTAVVGTYMGIAKIAVLAAAMGAPGGPVGWVIAGIIGAICAGLLVKYGVEAIYDFLWPSRNAMNRITGDALKFFFNDRSYDYKNKNKFNKDKLRKNYYRLCLVYHPDRHTDAMEAKKDWLILGAHYGVLLALLEETETDLDAGNDESKKSTVTKAIM